MAKLQWMVAMDKFSSSARPTHIWFDGECQEVLWNYQDVLSSSHLVIFPKKELFQEVPHDDQM